MKVSEASARDLPFTLVVGDDFLIKVVDLVHGWNIFWVSARQETKVSISSRVL